MAHILLFHSVLGLRPVEHGLADKWRAAGHKVTLPDLFDGRTAETYDDGFAILRDITLDEVSARALKGAGEVPTDSVLAGVSMGAGMASRAWETLPEAKGILFLAGPAPWVSHAAGTPVQMHAAKPEPFDEESVFEDWEADNPGARLDVFRYEDVGHYFLDESLPDYGAEADRLCRERCLAFLSAL
ncbi:dienelactone hydrolase family protein [Pelagovum pacificum]|uniref:Dienelactone hydrolase n=1 Tax=Pelagovum pacificum TaxID=2588711 RepID=A0A5C5GF46_9RHOB|nr:dienelactone hydrolase family protein [Pelagovum pacificum]QQA44674.1 dienelactone hydrolase family protein [Pelagovum pacificum]TNY32216.1 dienelactone hydrolase [Pelagovum pacificum]